MTHSQILQTEFSDNNVYQLASAGTYHLGFRRSGNGTPVLLLHGVASYSFLWDS